MDITKCVLWHDIETMGALIYLKHTHSHIGIPHCCRAMHICVSKLTIIGSDNDLSPGRCQAIIWTNDGILLIGPLGTNFSEILSKNHTLSFRKRHLKTSSAKWWPFCRGLNVLTYPFFLSWHNIKPSGISRISRGSKALWFSSRSTDGLFERPSNSHN